MNLTEKIKKLDKIEALVEKLATKRESVEDEILDWIYAERMDVVKWHLPGYHGGKFSERHPRYHTLSLRTNASFATILSKDNYGDQDVWEMEIPLRHLQEPEIVDALRKEQAAQVLVKEAQNKASRKLWLEAELLKLQSPKP